MAKEVVLAPLAVTNYDGIVDYVFNKWGIKATNNFISRFEDSCKFIAVNPEIYPLIHRIKQIRKCVVTKHNVLYFKEFDTTIRILTVFDTRQNPEKLNSIF